MINGKQRSYLRSLANGTDTTVYVGKEGVSENVLAEIDRGLEARELIKVKIQESCDLDPKTVANEVAPKLGAEFVQAIGRRFVLYRRAKAAESQKIELPR